uniref:Uncharacterized protein n=1 Tax=Arundo donax TaxID=35708 RepID=A0A0A9ABH0_ARUDO
MWIAFVIPYDLQLLFCRAFKDDATI